MTLLQTKQTEEAITQLLEVAKEKPAAEVYLALGEAYEKTKRDVSAIEYYQKAIQAAPNSAEAISNSVMFITRSANMSRQRKLLKKPSN